MSNPDHFRKLDDLFRHARSLPRDQRWDYLESECGDDEDLLRDALALLAEDDQTRGVIDEPVLGETLQMERIGLADVSMVGAMPEQIGRYRIIRRIGEGGMGVVYEAVQDSPRRRVALKIINAGVSSGRVLRRFEQEADVLGRLQHPGIAQIFEAGMFDSGAGAQPFFAMEFVDGEPLTRYAAHEKLSTRQRLVLLAKICDAVQHAHQRGVIHRDLKPANILVVDDAQLSSDAGSSGTRVDLDVVGQPKVLDFGVARATDSDLKTTTMRTDIGQLIGTVPYMSPEQAAGDPDELDTRSDVYALGVIAYELLAGRLPYDLGEKLIHEAVRVIREDDPAPLSSLDRVLGGDIETIVGKALEKDKQRRYESASALGSDIRRYLNDEPIAARPPSAWYQLRKLAKRNKQVVAGLAALFVVLVAASVVSTVFAVREARAAARAAQARDDADEAAQLADAERKEAEVHARIAEAVNEFLNRDLLAMVDPELGSRTMTVREVLDLASVSIGDRFQSEPLVEAEIRITLGQTYGRLGEFEPSEEHLERALELRRTERGDHHPETLEVMQLLAETYHKQGRHDDARRLLETVLEQRRALYGERHIDTVATLNNLALLMKDEGDYDGAQTLFERALPIQRELRGDLDIDTLAIMTNLADVYANREMLDQAETMFMDALLGRRQVYNHGHPRVLSTMDGLAQLYVRQDRLDEALALYEKVISARQLALGEDHMHTLGTVGRTASLQAQMGDFDHAIPMMEDVLERRRRTLGDDHPDVLAAVHDLGTMLQQSGQHEEAEPVLAEALQRRRVSLGNDNPSTAVSMNNLALTLSNLGRRDEAIVLYEEAVPVLASTFGPEHSNTVITRQNLARLYFESGRHDDAEQLYSQVIDASRRTFGEQSVSLLMSLNELGYQLMKAKRFDEAEPLLDEALTKQRRIEGDLHPRTFTFMNNLASVYAGQSRYEESEKLFLELIDGVRRHLGPDHPALAGTMMQMCDLAFIDRPTEAEPHLREALVIYERIRPAGHPQIETTRSRLGECLAGQEKFEEAEPLLVGSARAISSEFTNFSASAQTAISRVVDLYVAWERPEDAEVWRDRLISRASAADGENGDSAGGGP